MIVERFTFPGGLCFELESEDPAAVAFFQAEYGWARGGANRPADLSLHWQPALWPSPRADETAHGHKLLARWCYRVELAADRIGLQARGNRLALPMVHHMLVHSSLRFLAAGRGQLFLHAAALAREGRSVLLTGRGGVGKTTTSSLLLARGDERWRYHADDYVLLDPAGGLSYAYPTRSHLYGELLDLIPELATRLTVSERVRVHLFGALRRWSRRRLQWPTRVRLERLWPTRSLAPEGRIGALVLLARGPVESLELSAVSELQSAAEELLEMNFYEARNFRTLLLKHDPQRQEAVERLAAWREAEAGALNKLVQSVPCFRLTLPERPAGADLAPRLESALMRALDAGTVAV